MTNEEAIKLLLHNVKGFEVRAAAGTIINAIEKSEKYRWNDLRKNNNDLPKNHSRVLFCDARNVYGICEYYEGFNCHKSVLSGLVCRDYELCDVVGWRYIEPFEE